MATMPRPSQVTTLLTALTAAGGVAGYADLVRVSSRGALGRAIRDGHVTRVGRGVYALSDLGTDDSLRATSRAWSRWHDGPDEVEIRALAARLTRARGATAALSHVCAAAHHGWPVLRDPVSLDLAVPYGRNVDLGGDVRVRRAPLTDDERRDCVTSPLRTVLDCARDLPPVEALAVADSALRAGAIGSRELAEAGLRYRGRSVDRVRWVTGHAHPGADNPFESALRAILIDVPGLHLVPQVEIVDTGLHARVDLADERLRLVVEADSYEFHGSAEAFARDRRRYVHLTVGGWTVLPFGFHDVTKRPEWVRSMVAGAVIGLSAAASPVA